MRISGGHLKGRKVASQKYFSSKNVDTELRPTSSKVREAIFDIQRSVIHGSCFLDLYAGTGAVGFESISRGAASVYFVEENRVRSRMIEDFIRQIGLNGSAYVYGEKVQDFLKREARSGITFDIIFADPPYASDEIEIILPLIAAGDLLRNGGCIMVEHSSRRDMPKDLGALMHVKNYRYGDTMLTSYKKES